MNTPMESANTGEIKNSAELEFVIFCIESVAKSLAEDPVIVYDKLKKSGILANYLIPVYEPLHTQGKEYIVNDLIEVMKKRGVPL